MINASDLRDKELVKSVFRKIFLPALTAGASANLAGMIDGIIVGNSMTTIRALDTDVSISR